MFYCLVQISLVQDWFRPVQGILIVDVCLFVCFRVQGKSLRLSMSTSPQYDHIRGESAFENPTYETAVSKACAHQKATSATSLQPITCNSILPIATICSDISM